MQNCSNCEKIFNSYETNLCDNCLKVFCKNCFPIHLKSEIKNVEIDKKENTNKEKEEKTEKKEEKIENIKNNINYFIITSLIENDKQIKTYIKYKYIIKLNSIDDYLLRCKVCFAFPEIQLKEIDNKIIIYKKCINSHEENINLIDYIKNEKFECFICKIKCSYLLRNYYFCLKCNQFYCKKCLNFYEMHKCIGVYKNDIFDSLENYHIEKYILSLDEIDNKDKLILTKFQIEKKTDYVNYNLKKLDKVLENYYKIIENYNNFINEIEFNNNNNKEFFYFKQNNKLIERFVIIFYKLYKNKISNNLLTNYIEKSYKNIFLFNLPFYESIIEDFNNNNNNNNIYNLEYNEFYKYIIKFNKINEELINHNLKFTEFNFLFKNNISNENIQNRKCNEKYLYKFFSLLSNECLLIPTYVDNENISFTNLKSDGDVMNKSLRYNTYLNFYKEDVKTFRINTNFSYNEIENIFELTKNMLIIIHFKPKINLNNIFLFSYTYNNIEKSFIKHSLKSYSKNEEKFKKILYLNNKFYLNFITKDFISKIYLYDKNFKLIKNSSYSFIIDEFFNEKDNNLIILTNKFKLGYFYINESKFDIKKKVFYLNEKIEIFDQKKYFYNLNDNLILNIKNYFFCIINKKNLEIITKYKLNFNMIDFYYLKNKTIIIKDNKNFIHQFDNLMNFNSILNEKMKMDLNFKEINGKYYFYKINNENIYIL